MNTDTTVQVLLVDDDPLVLEVLGLVLTEGGFACQTACDGFEAIRRLLETPFDIIISDLRMPNIPGVELLGIIRQRFPETGVVVISSEQDPSDGIGGVPVDAFFKKGTFTHQELVGTVRTLSKQYKSPVPRGMSKPLQVTAPARRQIEVSPSTADAGGKKMANARKEQTRNAIRFNIHDDECAGFRVRGIYDPWEQAWRIKTWPSDQCDPVHDCWVKGSDLYGVQSPGTANSTNWAPTGLGEKYVMISSVEKKAILTLIDKWESIARRLA